MTEEIIVDGVDVAECPHRKKEVTFMNVIKCYNYGACEGVNCLYKQLQRSKQENEAYKSSIIANLDRNISKRYAELLDENEKLDNEAQDYHNTILKLDDLIKEIKQDNEKLKEEMDNYRKALEEIKEIAQDIIENDVYENSDAKAENILDKINECIGG